MPELFFKYLLDDHYRPTLEDVQSFNEEIYNAMVSIQKMDDGKYLEVLQADFYEDNMKRDEYIKVSLEERLYQPIQWQLKMLGEGFKSVINSDMLTTTGATPFDFHKITLGGEGSINKNFQIRDIFKIATDSEITADKDLVDAHLQSLTNVLNQQSELDWERSIEELTLELRRLGVAAAASPKASGSRPPRWPRPSWMSP